MDGSPLVVSNIGRHCEQCAEGEYEGEQEDSRERRDHEIAVGEPGENRYRIQRGRDWEINETDVDGSFASTEDREKYENTNAMRAWCFPRENVYISNTGSAPV